MLASGVRIRSMRCSALNLSRPACLLCLRPKGSPDIGMTRCRGKKNTYRFVFSFAIWEELRYNNNIGSGNRKLATREVLPLKLFSTERSNGGENDWSSKMV